uniref:Zn(2)-C6 fungal-type domain-containing protein n=1 Tax=Mycena chlorophos TaxID=658473 RepID=A0ABQ0L9M2_MYCCL|nr:predicted protein [Mycena chlorophos]
MASKAKPTCITCRERKIRCDGQNPCSRCRKTRKPTVCQYELGSDASLRVGLPKGVACAPCRQKKKRCDGNRPCDACTSMLREDDCKSPPPTVRRPPRARIAPVKVAALIEDAKAPWKRCLKVSRDCSAIPQALAFSFPSRAAEFYTRLRIHGDEAVELGLMRNLFLQHAWQFGFNLTTAKRNAIRLGDTSGRLAPPIYVPLAQLMGYMLSDPRRTCDEYQYVGFAHSAGELDQIQKILGYLREGNDGGTPDPLTCMQVYRLLGAYCGIRADTRGSREFMGNASNLLLKHAEWLGINVAPEESSTDEEALSALSHLVYLEAIMTTLRKIPHGPQLPPVILAKFMQLVAQAEQRTEATFVKAKSALFLVETQKLVAEWHDWQSGTFDFNDWTQRFCALARKLNTHLLFVQQTQRDLAHSNASRGQLVSYCGCAMITLTAIAEMYAVFAPFHHAPRVKFQEVVSALRRVQSTLAEQECRLCTLDVSAGVVGREIREEQPTVQWMLYMDTVLFPMYLTFLKLKETVLRSLWHPTRCNGLYRTSRRNGCGASDGGFPRLIQLVNDAFSPRPLRLIKVGPNPCLPEQNQPASPAVSAKSAATERVPVRNARRRASGSSVNTTSRRTLVVFVWSSRKARLVCLVGAFVWFCPFKFAVLLRLFARQKKRRCDGNRPCKACVGSVRESDCKAPRRSLVSATIDPKKVAARIERVASPWLSTVRARESSMIPHAPSLLGNLRIRTPEDRVLEPGWLRTLFLEHVWRYGLNIGAAKRDAIALGDTSGRVVHPIYINVAQLIGYILANPHHSGGKRISYERTVAEAAQAQIVFGYLREPDWDEGTDPLTYIQIYRLLAAYCTLKADRRGSREFVGNASNLMLRHTELLAVDGDVGCTSATTQELTPDEEARSALSHLVYLEAVAGTILKEDHAPQLPPAMLAKFMALSASLGDREVEVNYVKAKSALLFIESKNIISEWDDWPSTGRFDGNEWTQRFCALAQKLNTHLLFVQRVQNGFALSGAPRGQLISFAAGTMLTLAAIAELYAVFAPFHPAPRTKFHEVVGAIRRVDRRLVEQERALFDCTLDICDAIASKEMPERDPTSQWTAYMDTVLFPMYLSTLI